MKISSFKTIAVFSAVSMVASVSLACGHGHGGSYFGNRFGGNYGYSNSYSTYPSNYSSSCSSSDDSSGNEAPTEAPVETTEESVGQAFEPFHSTYVILPGDSFFTVSLKEYGTSANAKFIAQFNNMAQNGALKLGQTLKLPSISANGRLTPSRAPAAETTESTSNDETESAEGPIDSDIESTPPRAAVTAISAPLPKFAVGSTLLVDGQRFGAKPGVAKLRVGGAALKIQVLEWTSSSVKIRLPQLDLASASNASIEVVRADGTIASKTGIELNAPSEVALGN